MPSASHRDRDRCIEEWQLFNAPAHHTQGQCRNDGLSVCSNFAAQFEVEKLEKQRHDPAEKPTNEDFVLVTVENGSHAIAPPSEPSLQQVEALRPLARRRTSDLNNHCSVGSPLVLHEQAPIAVLKAKHALSVCTRELCSPSSRSERPDICCRASSALRPRVATAVRAECVGVAP